jgi:hypothetical protein
MVELFAAVGVGQWLRYMVGTLEVAGAVGLLLVSALIAWGRRSRTKALAGRLQR